jgi:hypothetical protein
MCTYSKSDQYVSVKIIRLNMIKYWVRLSKIKINTSSTLLSECLLLSEALHKQNKKGLHASIDTILKYLNVSAKSMTPFFLMFRRTSRKRGYLPSSPITALFVAFFPTLIEYLHSVKCSFAL